MQLNTALSQQIFGVVSALTREYGQEPVGQIPLSIMDREIKKLIRIKNEVAVLEDALAQKAGVSQRNSRHCRSLAPSGRCAGDGNQTGQRQ